MSINKNNYQAFFLDYHEGNLSPQQVADLLLFVGQHPEINEEFESFENVTLDDFTSISFENKADLKKQITLENKEDYFIRSVENNLTVTEKILLNKFIKQHPQFLPELELFQKTILIADETIFENKDELKRLAWAANSPIGNGLVEILVSSMEGLLSSEETELLHKQLLADEKIKHDYFLYQHTKLIADTSIVYENKEELKQKEKKLIPLFYYLAVAASLLLLFGLSVLLNKGKTEQHYAVTKALPEMGNFKKSLELATSSVENEQPAFAKNKSFYKKQHTRKMSIKSDDSLALIKKEIEKSNPENIVGINPKIYIEMAPDNSSKINEDSLFNTNQLIFSTPEIAIIEPKREPIKSKEFLTLRELAAEKIKQKTLDRHTLEAEEKSGHLKKFNVWDLAQLAAKGLSKLTGRKVDVRPTYNDQGDVTAYALGAGGLGFSKGR